MKHGIITPAMVREEISSIIKGDLHSFGNQELECGAVPNFGRNYSQASRIEEPVPTYEELLKYYRTNSSRGRQTSNVVIGKKRKQMDLEAEVPLVVNGTSALCSNGYSGHSQSPRTIFNNSSSIHFEHSQVPYSYQSECIPVYYPPPPQNYCSSQSPQDYSSRLLLKKRRIG